MAASYAISDDHGVTFMQVTGPTDMIRDLANVLRHYPQAQGARTADGYRLVYGRFVWAWVADGDPYTLPVGEAYAKASENLAVDVLSSVLGNLLRPVVSRPVCTLDASNDAYQRTATHAEAVEYLSTLPVRVLQGLADLNLSDAPASKPALVRRLAADRHPR